MSKLITDLLRRIGEEASEGITVQGETKLATKTEALARLLWKMALGYEQEEKDASGQMKMKRHNPDKVAQGIILDRIEGRISQTPTGRDERPDIPPELTDSGKKNIAEAGKTIE